MIMLNNLVQESISELNVALSQDESQYKSVTDIMRSLTLLMRSAETRSDLSNEHWVPVLKLSKECLQIFSKNDHSLEELELITELLRFLRNCCGGSISNQYFILNNEDLLNFTNSTLTYSLQKETIEWTLILKISVQLFGNILVSNENSKPFIWNKFFGDGLFRVLFQHKDLSVQECTMMVLFNSMGSEENSRCIFNTKEGQEIITLVTTTLLNYPIDWGTLFIEHLSKLESFWICYKNLPFKNKLLVLDIMEEILKCSQDENCIPIPISSLEMLKSLFLNHIMQMCNIRDSSVEPAETLSMLSVLCSASISNAYITVLQNSKDLLQACVECLKCIHFLGRDKSNVFCCLSDLKHMSSKFGEEIACHPFYGFKKNLIRLIGNLCYNCTDNQDMVRQLDGIPLVLDCCKFDAKNPYITQWCILAIRNISENNLENQSILAQITVSGEIADSKVLKEMGFQVHKENGKFHLRSTK